MTVPAETSRVQSFNGSNSTGPFTVNWPILLSTSGAPYVVVTHIDADGNETELDYGGGDYSFTAVQRGIGGGVFYTTVAVATGERVVISGDTPITQVTPYANQGPYYPETHGQSFDKLTLVAQELSLSTTLALRFPVTDTAARTATLPNDILRANKAVIFDEDGNVTVSEDDYNDQAANAAASAATAVAAQLAAEAALASTLSAYDNFDDRYLGAKSSDPTVDNDGNALVGGALYYNTSIQGMKVWTGSAWVVAYVNGGTYLAIANNLSDLASAPTALTNLGGTTVGKAVFTAANTAAARTALALPHNIGVACSDEVTSLTTGTAKVTFRADVAMTLTGVRLNVNTAPTGAALIVNIKKNGTTIFSTKPQIDISAKTSVGSAVTPVFSSTSVSADDEFTVDVDQVGSTIAGKGLKIWLLGTLT